MNNEAVQAKLADLERQVKELKGQLAAPGRWVPKFGERYLWISMAGDFSEAINNGKTFDRIHIANGNAYPDTHEGRAAAENAAFLIGFRARWRLSADVPPGNWRWSPVKSTKLNYIPYDNADGLPGWSTEEKCRAFVDSEGGPERFAEILGRGIL